MNTPVNVLVIDKSDGERWLFLYDDASHDQLLQRLGRFASNSDLSFTWGDAAVLSQHAARIKREVAEKLGNAT